MESRPEPSRGSGALHAAMLPLGVPLHPELELTASAVVQDDVRAAGDWFDTLPVDDGALALVAGDVVGHGQASLAVAAQLRSAVLLAVSEDDDPGRVLTRVARYARTVPEVAGAAICVVVVDPATGTFRYAVSGYPPPVVVAPSGATAPLAATGDGRLGSSTAFHTRTETLADDEVLLLASDGFRLPTGEHP